MAELVVTLTTWACDLCIASETHSSVVHTLTDPAEYFAQRGWVKADRVMRSRPGHVCPRCVPHALASLRPAAAPTTTARTTR